MATLIPKNFETVAPSEIVCAAVKRQREGLRNAHKTAEELLATFEKQGLTLAVARLRQFVRLL